MLREPVMRSVVVTVLSLRLLVMRLPERDEGSFCTMVLEREAVTSTWETLGVYSKVVSPLVPLETV